MPTQRQAELRSELGARARMQVEAEAVTKAEVEEAWLARMLGWRSFRVLAESGLAAPGAHPPPP